MLTFESNLDWFPSIVGFPSYMAYQAQMQQNTNLNNGANSQSKPRNILLLKIS